MVKRLHSAGIEVILDVVYNHSAEGNHLGPTLSFRGIDNTSYYRLFARRSRIVLLRRELDRIQEGATPFRRRNFFRGRLIKGSGVKDHRMAHAGWPRDDRRGVEQLLMQNVSGFILKAAPPARTTIRASRSRMTISSFSLTAIANQSRSFSPCCLRPARGIQRSTPAARI